MNTTTNMTRSSLCGLVCLSLLVLNGCANPIVQRTYLNNLEQGNEAMDRNDFAVAEEAFRRALINVRVGNLSPAAEEAALYNLARVYRMQGLYTDAAPLFRQAIEIQEKLDPESASMSRALAELARTYYFQGKYQEVAPLLERALAIIDKHFRLESTEFWSVAALDMYADALRKINQEREAAVIEARIKSLLTSQRQFLFDELAAVTTIPVGMDATAPLIPRFGSGVNHIPFALTCLRVGLKMVGNEGALL